jgi:hypothetical protein
VPEASVQVELQANVGRLATDLRAATNEVQNFSKGVSRDVAGAMAPANEAMRGAESVHRGFLGTLREFKAEQVQQGRQARFLAGEIASIIPAAEGARGHMEGFLGVLIEGAAGGLSFGLALETVKLGVGLLTSWMEEHSKRAAEVLAATRKMGDESFASVIALGRQIDAINGTPLTKTQEAIRKATDDANQELTKQRRIVADMEREGKLADTLLGDPTKNAITGGDSAAYKHAKEDLLNLEQGFRQRVRDIRMRGDSEEREASQSQLKVIEVERLQHEASQATGVQAIRKKLEADLKALALDRELTDSARETRRIHLEDRADQEILKLRRQLAHDTARLEVEAFTEAELGMVQKGGPRVQEPAWFTGMRKGELVSQGAGAQAESWTGMELGNTSMNEAIRLSTIYTERQKEAQEVTQRLGAAGMNMGSAFGTIFAQMVKGSKSMAQGMEDMAKTIINTVIEMAKKVIMASALEAAAEAYAAEAGAPVVGPILGAAAMVAALSAVQGLLGSMPSAAGGFDIPAGVNPVTQLHQREMVLPAEIADQFRNGGGGGQVIINVAAIDAKSFESHLYNQATPLGRVVARLQREGRWPT